MVGGWRWKVVEMVGGKLLSWWGGKLLRWWEVGGGKLLRWWEVGDGKLLRWWEVCTWMLLGRWEMGAGLSWEVNWNLRAQSRKLGPLTLEVGLNV